MKHENEGDHRVLAIAALGEHGVVFCVDKRLVFPADIAHVCEYAQGAEEYAHAAHPGVFGGAGQRAAERA